MDIYFITSDKSTEKYIKELSEAALEGLIQLDNIHNKNTDFLVDYLGRADKSLLNTKDQLVPSHDAPHVLAQVFLRLLDKNGYKAEMESYPESFGMKYEMDLETGIRAISVANGRCPLECSEAEYCTLKRKKIDWNIGNIIKEYSKNNSLTSIQFFCANMVKNVATIPMKYIVSGWFDLKKTMEQKAHSKVLISTHSRCHAITALLHVGEK